MKSTGKLKWLPLIFMLILVLVLTACGGDDDDDNDSGNNSSENADNNGGDESNNGGSDTVTANLASGTITVTAPDGWVSQGEDGDAQLWLASNDAALAKTDRGNTEPVEAGEIVILVVPIPAGGAPPSAIVDGMRAGASADDPFEFTGESEDVTIGEMSGVRAPVGNPVAEGWGYFVTYDDNYMLMVLGFAGLGEYNDDIDSTVRGVIQSVTDVGAVGAPAGDG